MTHQSVMSLFALLLGLLVGSFLNVCIYRIPIGKSIVHPPSSCPHCARRIRFYDNLPLVSYIILLGRCRYCRQPIPFQYPMVEAIFGLLSLALFTRYGPSFQYGILLLFSGALVVISFIDLRHQIIPDVISLPGIPAGVAASLLVGTPSWSESLIGAFAGGAILYLVALIFSRVTGREGMGGGDIKLLAMIGAWVGWKALPFIILASSFSGTVIGGTALIVSGKGLRIKIPFGPFLCLGTFLYLFFGSELTRWYFSFLH
jgi:leader peptidase (prepilin peptidase) / N-methyltransferase